MNKSLKAANLAHTKAWLQQARAELSKTTTAPSTKGRPSSATQYDLSQAVWPLLAGLILLLLLSIMGLLVLLFLPSGTRSDDIVAALDISTVDTVQPYLADLPPAPTPTLPPPDIVARYVSSALPFEAPALPQAIVTNSALEIRGVELTQGIQVFQEPENPRCVPDPKQPDFIFCNNSMPMIAGRHTMLRVYLACQALCPSSATTVQLRVLKDGQEQATFRQQLAAQTLQQVTPLPLYDLRLVLGRSVNFEFLPPPTWMSGQITFEVTAQTQIELEVAQTTLSKDFTVRVPLRIAYLPIEYQGLRPPDPQDADYWLLRLYPVSAVEYYRLPMPDVIWDGDVSKGDVLRKLLYTYWFYAQYNPLQTRPDQLFGWLPQELYNGGASDPFWCPGCAGPHSSRVAFGGLRPEQDIGGPRILAHEIAHNLGAQHAWSPTNREDTGCFRAEGVDIQVDPGWPYAQTPHIQEVGIDLYSTPPVIHPPFIYDMMAYCTQPWISPHTYRKLFDSPFLNPASANPVSMPDFQPQLETDAGGALLVSGLVYPDGTVSRPEIIKLTGDAFGSGSGFSPPLEFTPPPGDDYCLEVQADHEVLLARHCFDVGFTDLESGLSTEASPYFFTLPHVNTAEVNQVRITKNQAVIIEISPSNNPPQVTLTFPHSGDVLRGQQTITWESHDLDGDSLTYDLLYSIDAGQSWLPLALRLSETHYTFYTNQLLATNQAVIRVIANDGFNTTIDETDGPFTLSEAAENSISLISPPVVKPGQTFEVDVVAQHITTPGLFGVQFELAFDPTLVDVTQVRTHSALDLVVDDSINPKQGLVSVVASRKGQVANLTGDITLATVTFIALQHEGELHLDLAQVKAGAKGGLLLSFAEVQGGQVLIVAE